jgi:hypothetical protein
VRHQVSALPDGFQRNWHWATERGRSCSNQRLRCVTTTYWLWQQQWIHRRVQKKFIHWYSLVSQHYSAVLKHWFLFNYCVLWFSAGFARWKTNY